jgi:uncharacterized protein DUF3379
MTELEVRRQLTADPRHLEPEVAAAVEADARLASLRDDLLRNDAAMQAALTGAPVPEGLADRLVLRARFGSRSRWGLALAAAAAVLVVGIPGYFGVIEQAEAARDDAMMAHVAESTGELADDGNITPATFRASVEQLGLPVSNAGYRIRHLGYCVIAGIESRHFVLQGPNGAISYVILPGARGFEGERMVERGTMRGLFSRRDGFTVGVFGEGNVDRTELERMMRAVVAQG